MTDRDSFLAAIHAEPDETVHRQVFADWLEENGEGEAAARLHWWEQVRPQAADAGARYGACGWGQVSAEIDRSDARAEWASRLGCVVLHRLVWGRHPVWSDRTLVWPRGWSAPQYRDLVTRTVLTAELFALGLAAPADAGTAAKAAFAAAMVPGAPVSAAVWSAAYAAAGSVRLAVAALGQLPAAAGVFRCLAESPPPGAGR